METFKTISNIDCYGRFDREECFSVSYNLPNGEGVEDYVEINSCRNWTQLIKELKETLKDCEILEITCEG